MKGNLYVIAAPSGAGKTTLVKAVLETLSSIMVSISHTTRSIRPAEKQGEDYYFITTREFERMIKAGEFLEYAVVFQHLYGTSKTWVCEQLAREIDVILEIDWQGHQQIKHLLPESVSIFIMPPSLLALSTRLKTRQQDHDDAIAQRLLDAKETLSHAEEFDYIVLNDDFLKAKEELCAIILANRLKAKRQIKKLSSVINEIG